MRSEDAGYLTDEDEESKREDQLSQDIDVPNKTDTQSVVNEEEEEYKVKSTDRIILASLKLPVKVVRDEKTGELTLAESHNVLYPMMHRLREKEFTQM